MESATPLSESIPCADEAPSPAVKSKSTPPAVLSESGRHVVLTDEAVEAERKRLRLAPAFDRLVESNLSLVTSVRRLTSFLYVMAAVQTTTMALVVFALWRSAR